MDKVFNQRTVNDVLDSIEREQTNTTSTDTFGVIQFATQTVKKGLFIAERYSTSPEKKTSMVFL